MRHCLVSSIAPKCCTGAVWLNSHTIRHPRSSKKCSNLPGWHCSKCRAGWCRARKTVLTTLLCSLILILNSILNLVYCRKQKKYRGDRKRIWRSSMSFPEMPTPRTSPSSIQMVKGKWKPLSCVQLFVTPHSGMSDSLRPHESQHARPPCPSPTPGIQDRKSVV